MIYHEARSNWHKIGYKEFKPLGIGPTKPRLEMWQGNSKGQENDAENFNSDEKTVKTYLEKLQPLE